MMTASYRVLEVKRFGEVNTRRGKDSRQSMNVGTCEVLTLRVRENVRPPVLMFSLLEPKGVAASSIDQGSIVRSSKLGSCSRGQWLAPA